MKKTTAVAPRMSDEAVRAKTGKDWPEWFAILDKAGGSTMDHKAIVAYLVERYQVPSWWRQMVAVTYEQARGLRAKHEKPEGYSISKSKTLAIPVDRAFRAWTDPKARAAWLGEPGLVVRKATANKSVRLTWSDGKTSIETGFFVKGPAKTQVAVQHSKLADAKAAEAMKRYWEKRLERLAEWAQE